MYQCEACGTIFGSIRAARECEILDDKVEFYDED